MSWIILTGIEAGSPSGTKQTVVNSNHIFAFTSPVEQEDLLTFDIVTSGGSRLRFSYKDRDNCIREHKRIILQTTGCVA